MVLALLATVVGAIVRFRRSRGIERQQMKWVRLRGRLYGARRHHRVFCSIRSSPLSGLFSSLMYFAEVLAFGSGPVAIGIAILRYRLYDIDIIVRSALLYATLTATLALRYFGSVVLLQQLLRSGSSQRVRPGDHQPYA